MLKSSALLVSYTIHFGCESLRGLQVILVLTKVSLILALCQERLYRFSSFACRFRTVCYPDLAACSFMTKALMNNLPCLLVLCTQALFAYYFWLAYGTMALFLGPLRTWSVILGVYLWYSSTTLQSHDLLEARVIWGNKDYYHFVGENKEGTRHAL